MALQAPLDLRRSDVFAPHLEHVFQAAVEHQRAGFIERADIAGVVPAVAIESLTGLHRILVITLENTVAAHQHFTVSAGRRVLARLSVEDAHLHARQRLAQPFDPLLQGVVEPTGRHRAGRLGHSEGPHVDGLRHRFQHRGGDGGWLHCKIRIHERDA